MPPYIIKARVSKHARSEETIVILNERIEVNPSRSVRKLTAEIGINPESARRILKADLILKPYKTQTSQQLLSTDNERRLRVCQQISGLSEEGRLAVNTIIFSD